MGANVVANLQGACTAALPEADKGADKGPTAAAESQAELCTTGQLRLAQGGRAHQRRIRR